MKLFKSILYAVAMALFMSFQTASATGNLATFGIDKTVYSKMSEDQKNKLIQKIQELNEFIELQVKTKIPADLIDQTIDLKINISFTDKPGRDGLFVPQDSGEHKISIQLVQVYSNGIKALLAHEIFHAIHYQINPDEAAWVREGMAQVFEFITTNELNGRNTAAAIQNPMTPLLRTYDVENNDPAQYGHNQLYFYYLYTHCGKDNLFWKLAAGQSHTGVKGSFLIDAILTEMNLAKPECKDFTESAITFEVAKAHNQFQFANKESREQFFLYPSVITPKFTETISPSDLKSTIQDLPVLSSFRMPLKKYILQKGECKNCAIYFAETDFPFGVSESTPSNPALYDIILVKLRRN
ncbi:hypothetical protein SHI21_06765 [Bacteriovorax sp. PP10]|uniref:DUF1570 domain-containing protein n=1 Tax=Bacteriovorax antarcticus TaxID=3088717 RepID=A0ABU5VS69_9BACT|nr:hypothetical protein [Bacteriovorax sp. PP10]MEA9355893.1 hypothetical protein [Bacteriovorax sp. PP10]